MTYTCKWRWKKCWSSSPWNQENWATSKSSQWWTLRHPDRINKSCWALFIQMGFGLFKNSKSQWTIKSIHTFYLAALRISIRKKNNVMIDDNIDLLKMWYAYKSSRFYGLVNALHCILIESFSFFMLSLSPCLSN